MIIGTVVITTATQVKGLDIVIPVGLIAIVGSRHWKWTVTQARSLDFVYVI